MRSISEAGLAFIKKYEGLRLSAYHCPAGIVTIGYGSTRYPEGRLVMISDELSSEEEATQLLLSTISEFESAVNEKQLNINQNQFDALVSFTYNVGIYAFSQSTLLRKAEINVNDLSIYDEFMRWNKASGMVLAGLTKRRSEEADLYSLIPNV
jgi:lysozyme